MSDTPLVRRDGGVSGGDSLTVDVGGSVSFASGSTLTVATGATVTNVSLNRRAVSESVPSGTAGVASAVTKRVFAMAVPVTIKAVTLIPSASCAGHATSNFTLSLRNLGTGATGTTDIATLALTTGNALVANVPKAMTLVTTAISVAALESIGFYQTLASSGIDYPPGTVTVEYSVDN
jgi:hypothetical protein